MNILKNTVIDNNFLEQCKLILSKIDDNPKILVQAPLFLDSELYQVQVQYKNLLFEAVNASDLFSLLNVYIFFVKKKINIFKDNSLYHIEIEKNLKISSENIIELKKRFSTYQNIKKSFPKLNIKNKLINQKLYFYANFYNTDFISNGLEDLAKEIKLYNTKRKQIADIISKYENDFTFSFEKEQHETTSELVFILTYKEFIIKEKTYNLLIKKFKNIIKLLIELKEIISGSFKLKQTKIPKIFIITCKNREIIGDKKRIIKELNLLIKYKIVQLTINF